MPGMKLRAFAAEKGWNDSELGRQAGRPEPTVRKHASGQRIPRQIDVETYYRISGGLVDPNSFYDLPELRPADRLRRAAMLEAEATALRASVPAQEIAA